jgi:hypothetical protein
VNGNEPKVEGRYYLRFTEGGKRRFGLVGGDAAMAAAAAQKKEAALKAKAAEVAIAEDSKPQRIKLADAIAEYEAEIKEHKAWSSYRAYTTALNLFVKGCKKTYVDEVSRGCIMAFAATLKKAALRCAYNSSNPGTGFLAADYPSFRPELPSRRRSASSRGSHWCPPQKQIFVGKLNRDLCT